MKRIHMNFAMKQFIIPAIFVLILNLSSQCQQEYWETYLNSDGITCMLHESDNILWIGTYFGGLIRLNTTGNEKEYFSTANSPLPSNYIRALQMDSEGNLWIATYYGLVRYNAGIWQLYTSKNSAMTEDAVQDILITEDDDIWIACWSSVIHINSEENWTVYDYDEGTLPFGTNRCIYLDEEDIVWVGYGQPFLDYGGLAKLENGVWTTYTNLNSGLQAKYVYDICSDNDGNIWMASYGDGIIKYTGSTFIQYDTASSDLTVEYFTEIAHDPISDAIYAGSGDFPMGFEIDAGGYFVFQGASLIQKTVDQGIPSNVVSSFLIEENGNNWFGTDKGLCRWTGTGYGNIETTENNLPSNAITCITAEEDSAHVWIGTENGLALYSGDSLHAFNASNSILPKGRVYWVVIDSENITWVYIDDTLYIYNDTIWTNTEVSISYYKPVFHDSLLFTGSYNSMEAINKETLTTAFGFYINDDLNYHCESDPVIDNNGRFWFAYVNPDLEYIRGIARYDGNDWSLYNEGNIGLFRDQMSLAIDSENTVWIAGLNDGLASFDGDLLTIFDETNSNVPLMGFRDIYIDKQDDIWLSSTSGGLVHYNRDTFRLINTNNSGLISDYIEAVALDKNNALWVGTGYGLNRYSGDMDHLITSYKPAIISNTPQMQAFPNPANESVFLQMKDQNAEESIHDVTVILYNALGQVVWQQAHIDAYNGVSVNLGQFKSGTYFAVFLSKTGLFNRKKILIIHE